jgi:hypothetical protein
MTAPPPGPAGFTWEQGVILATGAFYFVFGVIGFFFVRDLDTALTGQAPDNLLGIGLNGAQSFLHVLLGVIGMLSSTKQRSARGYGAVLAFVGIALFVLGVFVTGRRDINFLDLNWPANVLHLITGLVGLAVAAPLLDRRRPAVSQPEREQRS